MPTDTAITRLLYAMLSQKCLKDINWDKVARDPILAQEITNGHAARMRYSRFKKQMDGTTTTATRKPRKNKVTKSSSSTTSSSKAKPLKRSDEGAGEDLQHQPLKNERERERDAGHAMGMNLNPAAGESFNSQSTTSSSAREMQTPDPEPGKNMHTSASMHTPRMVKPEPGAAPYQPTTPLTSFSTPTYTGRYPSLSASPSPNTSFTHDLYASFGDQGMMGVGVGSVGGLYGEMIGGENSFVYGMGSPVGHHLGYHEEGLWVPQNQHHHAHVHGSQHGHGEDIGVEMSGNVREREGERVSVKSEPRWE